MKKLIVVLVMMFAVVSHNVWADSDIIYNPANGHSYQRIDAQMSWHEAKAHCEILGGYLATITSQEENDFVYSNIGIDGENHWLGATDEAAEGAWEWVTGETWSYSNWAVGQPDNDGGAEHYLSFWDVSPSNWNDLPDLAATATASLTSFICEWESFEGAISGFVSDVNHVLISNAQVRLYYRGVLVDSTDTDENGYYKFAGLHNGKYRVMAARYDYERQVKAGAVKRHLPWSKDEYVIFELVSATP